MLFFDIETISVSRFNVKINIVLDSTKQTENKIALTPKSAFRRKGLKCKLDLQNLRQCDAQQNKYLVFLS